MLSFKYHALYWALSLSTIPLTSLRDFLIKHGLFPDFVNDIHFPVICLTLYLLIRYTLSLHDERLKEDTRDVVTTFSGNVIAANLDETTEEQQIAKEQNSNRPNANGNGNGNANGKAARGGKGKRKFVRGANGKPRELQLGKESDQNGNARLANGNRTPQSPLMMSPDINLQRLRKASMGKKKPMEHFLLVMVRKHHSVLYFMSLALLCTRKDWVLGFGDSADGRYVVTTGRVLMTFMALGTLEPIRLDRWDVQVCGMEMFSSCYTPYDEEPNPCASALIGAGGLVVIGAIMETLYYMKLGQWLWWPEVWFEGALTTSDIWIRIKLLASLIDIVETILYAVSRHTNPGWYKERQELFHRPL